MDWYISMKVAEKQFKLVESKKEVLLTEEDIAKMRRGVQGFLKHKDVIDKIIG